MLDSERTFKIKVRSHWTVFGILFLRRSYLHLKSLHGKEIFQYLQNSKPHKVDQGHS